MILFVWSLIVSAINYARRQRLSDVLVRHFDVSSGDDCIEDRRSIMLRRIVGSGISKMASAPVLSAESSLLYRAEGFEVVRNWRAAVSPGPWILITSKSVKTLKNAVYFIACMASETNGNNDSYVQIENLCWPVAWRSGQKQKVEVLLASSVEVFIDTACYWAEQSLRYKKSFLVDSIQTVELSCDFEDLLRQRAAVRNVVGVEKVCVDDILAAKNICDSLSAAVPSLNLDGGESAQSSALSTPVLDQLKPPPTLTVDAADSVGLENTMEEENQQDQLSPLPFVQAKSKSGRATARPRRYSMFSTSGAEKTSSDFPSVYHRTRRRSLSPVSIAELGFPTASDAITSWGIRRMSSIRIPRAGPRRSSQQSANLALASGSPSKPPNVLIYSGGTECGSLISLVERCLPVDSYAVYSISHQHLLTAPWEETAACVLVVDTKTLSEKTWERLEEYFRKGGRCLFLCQNELLASLTDCRSSRKRISLLKLAFSNRTTGNTSLGKDFENFMKKVSKQLKNPKLFEQFHAKDLVGGHTYTVSVIREEGTPLVLYMKNGRRTAGALFTDSTLEAILSEGSTVVYQALEQLGMPVTDIREELQLTPGYLLTDPNEKITGASNLWLKTGKLDGPVCVQFCKSPRDQIVSKEYLPAVVCGNLHHLFDSRNYFKNLKTSNYGRSVLFVPVATSTMDIAQTLLSGNSIECDKLVVVARHQVTGKGRSGNKWLSPEGCAMFSFPCKLAIRSRLGRSPGYIQHLIALALVDGICQLPGFKDFELRLKWPNDIYFSRSHKLGGVLVNCTVQGSELRCVIGCGFNVSNRKPTVCLNDLLPKELPQLSVEKVIAVTLSRFEELLHIFQSSGYDRILPIYYEYWLHRMEEVLVEDRNERVQIRGLDSHGYLEVRSRATGHVFSLQPDGNTFDMMRNLIRLRN